MLTSEIFAFFIILERIHNQINWNIFFDISLCLSMLKMKRTIFVFYCFHVKTDGFTFLVTQRAQRAAKDKKFNTLSSSFDFVSLSPFMLFFYFFSFSLFMYIMCLRLLLTIMHIKEVFLEKKISTTQFNFEEETKMCFVLFSNEMIFTYFEWKLTHFKWDA